MGYLTKAIQSARSVTITARDSFEYGNKASRGLVSEMLTPNFLNPFGTWKDQAKFNERYNLFRNWVYAAINAIALEAAAQPVHVGRMGKKSDKPKRQKSMSDFRMKSLMTTSAFSKASELEIELLKDHNLVNVMECPNPVQGRSQFVYSFVANLCLTGWGYIVRDTSVDGKEEYYSLPTTWIKVDHKDGPFSRFRVVDPNNPQPPSEDDDLWFSRDQVGFAHLPNPADPMSALAPAASQMSAIRINDHIESSRERFFHNGIFPSVIVTVGKDPHPDVPGGIRPRLTSAQRQQIYNVIQKTMGGVSNYGMPAIVDGLIENITRFSMTDSEMGWEKSEKSVKDNILSAFCVHPYLLGEAVSVGGYAQVNNIEKRFYKRVNAYLDMLGNVITGLVDRDKKTKGVLVWWEKCVAEDPQRTDAMLRFARQNNDITQNEIRAKIGFGPDEDRAEQKIKESAAGSIGSLISQISRGEMEPDQANRILILMGIPEEDAKKITKSSKKKGDGDEDNKVRNTLLSTVGGMNGSVALMNAMMQGVAPESVAKLLSLFFEISEDEANKIVEPSAKKMEEQQKQQQQQMNQQQEGQEENTQFPFEQEAEVENPFAEEEEQAAAGAEQNIGILTETLEKALDALLKTPEEIADDILKKLGVSHGK